MRVTAEFEHQHNEHQERHEEVQTIKFRNAAEHEGDYRNAALRVTELACEKKARKHVEDACSKGGRIDNRNNPLVVGHVVERRRRAQVKHHDVYASEKTKTV